MGHSTAVVDLEHPTRNLFLAMWQIWYSTPCAIHIEVMIEPLAFFNAYFGFQLIRSSIPIRYQYCTNGKENNVMQNLVFVPREDTILAESCWCSLSVESLVPYTVRVGINTTTKISLIPRACWIQCWSSRWLQYIHHKRTSAYHNGC